MIKIESLCRDFGDFRAVDNITLSVAEGEIFCFLGPNGAGKTTTIKMLTGLLRPTSGSALIGGIDIRKEPIKAKSLIGYIPDMPFLYDRLTISEFIEFTGDIYNMPHDRVSAEGDNLLEMFGMSGRRNCLIKDLSHGMRQRITYVTTLLHSPKALFIDEPLIGLDPYSIRMIKDLLVRKARAGTAIFLTTHILSLAEDIADRIGIAHRGSLIALGRIEELRAKLNLQGSLEDMFLRITDDSKKGQI
jgi:ABC-2 type transport system ATP-binding protein